MHGAYKTDKEKSKSATDQNLKLDVPVPTQLTPQAEEEARRLDAELEKTHADDRVENVPVQTGEVLRVHGVYMSKRREFAIRTDREGRLELWDAVEKKVYSTG